MKKLKLHGKDINILALKINTKEVLGSEFDVGEFLQEFGSKQESLGKEFSDVLYNKRINKNDRNRNA